MDAEGCRNKYVKKYRIGSIKPILLIIFEYILVMGYISNKQCKI